MNRWEGRSKVRLRREPEDLPSGDNIDLYGAGDPGKDGIMYRAEDGRLVFGLGSLKPWALVLGALLVSASLWALIASILLK